MSSRIVVDGKRLPRVARTPSVFLGRCIQRKYANQHQNTGDGGGKRKRRDDASLPPPSSLRCPFPSIQLTANEQTAASIISLLNDYLLSQGKPALGFLNPWLYSGGLVGLNDITYGSNPGCNTRGFSAVPGWDPVRLRQFCVYSLSQFVDPGCRRSQVLGPLTSSACST